MTVQSQTMTPVAADLSPMGLPLGTVVMTLQGAMPVEYLSVGDRIITRSGARVLRAVSVSVLDNADVVHVAPGALGHDRPGQPLCLPAAQQVLVRDWRAQALFGTPTATVAVARLVDGEYLRHGKVDALRVFRLVFDAAETVYADGVEIVCPLETVAA
jgi:hypothetical protein